jgi:hypothetical protein
MGPAAQLALTLRYDYHMRFFSTLISGTVFPEEGGAFIDNQKRGLEPLSSLLDAYCWG